MKEYNMLSSKKWLLGLVGFFLSLGLMGATKCDVQAADYAACKNYGPLY